MRKVFHLVHVQLWAVLSSMLSIGNKKNRKPKVLYIGVVFLVILLGSISFSYNFTIGKGLEMFHCLEILPAMMMAVTSLIVLITTMFKVKGTIIGFRDYDMVMSLPISTAGVVASRLIILYSINLLFVFIVMIPMTIVYGILAQPTAIFYVLSMGMMLFLPLIPIIIASILGTLITFLASKFRYSNLVNIVISILLLAGFVGAPFTMNHNSGEQLVNISKALTNQVNSIYPLAGMYTKALLEYNYVALAAFLSISMIFFLLYCLLVAKFFKKINTIIMTGKFRSNYKMGVLKVSSQLKALYIKELKRYFASPLYVLNTAFGVVILTIVTIALIFVDPVKIFGDQNSAGLVLQFIPIFVSFCIVTCSTTMASISLEGKNLWIMKSLPVETKKIYHAKIAVNLTVVAPAVLDSILISFLLKTGWPNGIILIFVVIACSIFSSILGLLVNLKLPLFNWTNETIVVKQSAASLVAIFTGMAVVAAQYGFLILLPNAQIAYLLYIFVLVAVDIALYQVLMKWGGKRFAQL